MEGTRINQHVMLAARYHGNKDVRIETISEPVCREGYVKVHILVTTLSPLFLSIRDSRSILKCGAFNARTPDFESYSCW